MKVDPNIALSDTGFLFHASTGDSFSVNPTGLRILQLVKSNKTVEEMVTALAEEYRVEPEQAEEDLFDYLQYLRQLKILIDE
jgi:PqqD family protein of HPr-rel-A system